MTIQERVKSMHLSMAKLMDTSRSDRQRDCFELLHDAIIHTGPRIDDMDPSSLVEYIELAAMTVNEFNPSSFELRKRLVQLGFNTSQVN